MKKPKKAETNREPAPVRFELDHPTANSAPLAGSFNDWNPAAPEMIPDDAGRWLKERVLPPGTHEYFFVVDGEWVEDPRAAECVPNPCTRNNSILKVSEVVVRA